MLLFLVQSFLPFSTLWDGLLHPPTDSNYQKSCGAVMLSSPSYLLWCPVVQPFQLLLPSPLMASVKDWNFQVCARSCTNISQLGADVIVSFLQVLHWSFLWKTSQEENIRAEPSKTLNSSQLRTTGWRTSDRVRQCLGRNSEGSLSSPSGTTGKGELITAWVNCHRFTATALKTPTRGLETTQQWSPPR